jgi:hypothetical protein
MKRPLYLTILSMASLVAACGGDPPPPAENPPPPPATSEPAPTATATAAVEAPPPPPPEPPPPPKKTAKELFVGNWAQAFEGDLKTAAEEAAKKKGGKDEKKVAAELKKAEDAFAKSAAALENTADMHTMMVGGKAVAKFKYEAKEDGMTLNVKGTGKDEVSKKDAKGEFAFTFKDDNTIELKDPKAKDPKKAATLVFKRK